MTRERKAVLGWAMYDWANSAFATTVMAGFFPVFFKEYFCRGADVNTSTAMLGVGNSLASLAVAFLSPVLGAIADQGSVRKRFLAVFAYLGALLTAALALVGQGQWALAIVVYAGGVIGFGGANVFYDALLPGVADESRIDVVSGLGYALGYLGGGLLFFVNVLMTLMPATFGLRDAAQAVRWSFVSVALWWGGFTVLTLLWVPEERRPRPAGGAGLVSAGLRQLLRTFRHLRGHRTVLVFLVAYWLYIDGVDTIIRMAVDYGMSLGFSSKDLIVALLLVQFVGFPAALVFGKLGQRFGARRSIYLGLAVYVAVTLWGTVMKTRLEFYGLAMVIGLVQGGVQALSRSFYARLIPPGQTAEYFGFYDLLGKFAVMLGPALMGLVGLCARRLLMPVGATPAQALAVGHLATRIGLGSIVLLFLGGGLFFWFVDEERGKAEAATLASAAHAATGAGLTPDATPGPGRG
jgi:MFS transporter, UMF1 family